MPQTLLALGALSVLSLFVLQQSRSIQQAERNLIRNEVTAVAAGKVVEALDRYEAETLPEDGAVETVEVASSGSPLRFELQMSRQPVRQNGTVWEPAAPSASACDLLVVRATGPDGAPAWYRLPTDAGGSGRVSLSRVYCESARGS